MESEALAALVRFRANLLTEGELANRNRLLEHRRALQAAPDLPVELYMERHMATLLRRQFHSTPHPWAKGATPLFLKDIPTIGSAIPVGMLHSQRGRDVEPGTPGPVDGKPSQYGCDLLQWHPAWIRMSHHFGAVQPSAVLDDVVIPFGNGFKLGLQGQAAVEADLRNLFTQLDARPTTERQSIRWNWGLGIGGFGPESDQFLPWLRSPLDKRQAGLLIMFLIGQCNVWPTSEYDPYERCMQFFVSQQRQARNDRMQDDVLRPAEDLLKEVRTRQRKEVLTRKREILASGLRLEDQVADLLRQCGYECDVTPPRGDKGLDVLASKNGVRLGIQVRKAKVGRPAVQQTRGSAMEFGVLPAIVSATGFTSDAKTSARQGAGVRLADLDQLVVAAREGSDPFFAKAAP